MDPTPPTAPVPAPATSSGQLLCPACHYDLTGLTEPRCPECGQEVRMAAPGPESGLAVLSCRVLAVWCFIEALVLFGMLATELSRIIAIFATGNARGLEWSSLIVYFVGRFLGGVLLYASLGWLLWRFTPRLACRLVGGGAGILSFQPDHAVLFQAALMVLGIWLLVNALPQLAVLVIGWSSDLPADRPGMYGYGQGNEYNWSDWAQWLSVSLRALAGFLLLFGARRLSAFLCRRRVSSW